MGMVSGASRPSRRSSTPHEHGHGAHPRANTDGRLRGGMFARGAVLGRRMPASLSPLRAAAG